MAMLGETIERYTTSEGGAWIDWPSWTSKLVPIDQLLKPEKRHKTKIVNQIQLHSFETNRGRQWDAINGWR